MDNTKLRLKIGEDEFEAEGPPDVVAAQLEVWKELRAQVAQKAPVDQSQPLGQSPGQDATMSGGMAQVETEPWLRRVFMVDDKRNLVTLRVHPQGEEEEQDADAILLTVFGYKALRDEDEVLVTKLKESIRLSGLSVDRMDRAAAPHIDEGRLLKAGRAKGGKYRLTNTGLEYAKQLGASIAATLP